MCTWCDCVKFFADFDVVHVRSYRKTGMCKCLYLFDHAIDHTASRVTNVNNADTRSKVNNLVTVDVEQNRIARALDNDWNRHAQSTRCRFTSALERFNRFRSRDCSDQTTLLGEISKCVHGESLRPYFPCTALKVRLKP
ncbi:unannotated protein [freshwater metagenome]|uniref:Unannotated protein n=1 Tax=freshwater metagenome TaxID=449393 RepID=A0A6J6M770_9ZZZZ